MTKKIEKLTELFESISVRAQKLINESNKSRWVQTGAGLSSAQRAMTDFFYEDGQDGRTTFQCCAVIPSHSDLLDSLSLLNQEKSDFKAIIKQIKSEDPKRITQWQESLFSQHKSARNALTMRQIGRINLKAVWRQLKILDEPVDKISFNWYRSGRSITKITKSEVLDRLIQMQREGRNIDIAWRTITAEPDYQSMCIIQKQAPLIRVNVVFASGDRTAFNTGLPVFLTAQQKLPAISPLKPVSELKQRKHWLRRWCDRQCPRTPPDVAPP